AAHRGPLLDVPARKGSGSPFHFRSSTRRSGGPTCAPPAGAGSVRCAAGVNGSLSPDSDVRGHWHSPASSAAVAAPSRLPALPHLTRHGSAGKDRWWYGIGPAGSDRNELLPLNLLVQG